VFRRLLTIIEWPPARVNRNAPRDVFHEKVLEFSHNLKDDYMIFYESILETRFEKKMADTKPYNLGALKIDQHSRNRTGQNKRLKLLIIAGAVVAVGLIAMVASGKKTAVEISPARSISASEGASLLNASGYVTPRRRATVAAKITGRVQELLVEEGMHVEQGQVLAKIDSSDAEARLKAAEADLAVASSTIAEIKVNLADAGRTYKRVADLHAKGVASNNDFDKALAGYDGLKARLVMMQEQITAAQARREMALTDIENCIVRAPFSGIAVSKDAQVGEMVSPISAGGGFTRTGIATIVDMQSLEIEVDVNESYLAKVSQGQKVDATLDAYPDWHIPSTVRTIIPTADRQKATVKVRISFDALDPKILPDMGVKVSFLSTKEKKKDSIVVVRRSGVQDEEGRPVVYMFKDGRVQRHQVKTGEVFESDIEITDGVAVDDKIIVSSTIQPLQDGMRAEIKK
jgi:HlyD family secretion protein